MTLRFCMVFILAATLASCGFQLRGSNLETLKNSHVYIKSGGAGELAAQIKKQLEFANVPVVKDADKADYIIEVEHEKFDRSVLSVSAHTGKVEEYELTYYASLSIKGPDGRDLLQNEPVTARRDYTFDENSVLGKYDEEKKLREEITRYAADTVLRRLQALTR